MPFARALPEFTPFTNGGVRIVTKPMRFEVVLVERQPEARAILPELLVHTEVPREAHLGLERGVGEAREEQLVEVRRAEARARTAVDARPPLLDDVGERAALGVVPTELAVALHAYARRHEEPVEEPELLFMTTRSEEH